ncbi:uncharacterized protein LOC114020616 isoform X18 [Chelonia mydas]|uniref:uncharacterized protein LOC114020616 isoform X18 n=1 Tax=Chelonia mydas TaxID=8469 RepID=UPI001CA8F137|nr:uncharacterized protein LOC114020616 isoform X18 [Chelonia mydas]
MRFREPPPPARELWRSARARPTLSLTHGAVGVWARPERRDATQRNASPAPPFPAHRCSACALDQLFPSCPGCYKFSLPHFCPSFSSERAALQAAHACPQASGAMLHQLKRAQQFHGVRLSKVSCRVGGSSLL